MSISIVRSLQAFYQLMEESAADSYTEHETIDGTGNDGTGNDCNGKDGTGNDGTGNDGTGNDSSNLYYKLDNDKDVVVIVYFIFCSFVKRRNVKPEVFNSRFGLIYPMDIFSRQSRLPYCCAFGIATSALYDLIIQKGFFYRDTFPLGTLKAIACIFLYCTVFLNLLSALTIRTACSFAVGTVFVWALSANRILESLICFTSKEDTKSVFALRYCPVMACHIYMAIVMPWKCMQAIRRKEYVKVKKVNMFDTLDSIRESYQGQHVRKLLKHPVQLIIDSSQPKVDMTQQRLKTIYHGESGFKYPSKLLAVMFISTILIYLVTIDTMAVIIPHLNSMLDRCLHTLESVGYIKIEGENPEITNIRDTIHMVFNLTQCIFYDLSVLCETCDSKSNSRLRAAFCSAGKGSAGLYHFKRAWFETKPSHNSVKDF
ncbi:hypothetical protein Btru_006937 [Bulinus truncatus]|nr:hypothetical protein Btru_006937 [Bulinus truncatus]